MTEEGQNIDRKSLKMFADKNPQWTELAKDCVCFANARGGVILIGIEDGAPEPPHGQVIPPDLSEKIHKRVGELTVNVMVAATLKRTASGAEYIELHVPRSSTPASTTEYFIEPALLRRMDFQRPTTLSRIEPHRLKALIVEDLERYPGSAIGDVHKRIGPEINKRSIKRTIDELIAEGSAYHEGEKRGRRYWISK